MSIKKILCPTDFSKASNNAVEYAVKMAIKTNAEITLTHVLSLSEIYDNFTTFGMLNDYAVKRNEAEEKLKDYSNQVLAEFHIPCDYSIGSVYNESFPNEKTTDAKPYDLIISGTNGADNMNQFYFGSNSYRISKNADIPTLIVPVDCTFRDLNQLVFASGYLKGDTLMIEQLKNFMHDFNPSLTVLHVSEKDTAVSQEVYHSFRHLAEETFDFNQKINFQRIVDKDEAAAIEKFMHESTADVLAVCMEEHSFLYRLFHKSLIKKLASYADFPVLVFHK